MTIEGVIQKNYYNHFNEIKDELIKYIENHKKSLLIDFVDYDNYTYEQYMEYFSDINKFSQQRLISIDQENDTIRTFRFDKRLINILKEYLSKDIEELQVPSEFFDYCKLSEFKNLKKLTIIGPKKIMTKEMINQIIGLTNIKELSGEFKIADDLKDEIINFYNIKFLYKDILVNCSSYNPEKISSAVSSNPPKDIDKIISFSKEYNGGELDSLYVEKNINNKEKRVIHYSIDKDYETPNFDKINLLILERVDTVEDILKIEETFEKHNLHIDKIVLYLENKNYDNIDKLKKLDVKYKFRIGYEKTGQEITLNEFIMMRETLNYYKNMILEANLSPVEQIMYAYDLIKSFEYQENYEKLSSTRTIHSIVKDGKIVCAGYSSFFSQLLKELGIECYDVSTTVPRLNKEGKIVKYGHARCIAHFNDKKYGINGYYAFDPTWDSAHNIVKCVDENGNEEFKMTRNITEKDNVVKSYDNLSLYRYFLISGQIYQKVFEGEKMPDFKSAEHYNPNNYSIDDDIDTNFVNAERIELTKFIQILRNVKLSEGYPEDQINDVINDILEVNGFKSSSDKLEEVVQKR